MLISGLKVKPPRVYCIMTKFLPLQQFQLVLSVSAFTFHLQFTELAGLETQSIIIHISNSTEQVNIYAMLVMISTEASIQ